MPIFFFLLIRYAIALKIKLGTDRYEFTAKIFNLPSSRTVDFYSNISAHASDEIMLDTLHVQHDNFEHKNGDIDEMHWKRHGSLAWDSMSIKEKLEYNIHLMRIIRFAGDAFDLDIIKSELKNRISNNTDHFIINFSAY